MINAVPRVEYDLKFEKGKEMPLYMFYCLLANEYEFRREEPDFHSNNDYALDCLHTLMNGYPRHDNVYDDNSRGFTVRFGNGGNTKVAHVTFYADGGDTLHAHIQRGILTKNESSEKIVYEPSFHCSWDYDTLADYGLIKNVPLEDYYDCL